MPVVFKTPLCLNQFFLALWATVDDICENNRVARGALFGGSVVFFALTCAAPMFEYLLDSAYDLPRPYFFAGGGVICDTMRGKNACIAPRVMKLINNAASAPIDRIENDAHDVESGGSSDKEE